MTPRISNLRRNFETLRRQPVRCRTARSARLRARKSKKREQGALIGFEAGVPRHGKHPRWNWLNLSSGLTAKAHAAWPACREGEELAAFGKPSDHVARERLRASRRGFADDAFELDVDRPLDFRERRGVQNTAVDVDRPAPVAKHLEELRDLVPFSTGSAQAGPAETAQECAATMAESAVLIIRAAPVWVVPRCKAIGVPFRSPKGGSAA